MRGPPTPAAPIEGRPSVLREFLSVFRYSRRALQILWDTNPRLGIAVGLCTIVVGSLPAAAAWVGARIVDAVASGQGDVLLPHVLRLVGLEAVIIAVIALATRASSLATSLLREQISHRVNTMILDKALTLDLEHFEDSEFYDRLVRARREASTRPLGLVLRTFSLAQNVVSLVSFAVLLLNFSAWAVALLLLAGVPGFIAETRFSNEAFRLFRWRSPERRMQAYLETVLAREDHAKEVKLFGLGPRFLARYRAIFERLYAADRALAIRRDVWGFLLGLIAIAALYGAYAWVATSAVHGAITVGAMAMYLMLFRQGQAAVSAALGAISGMYEDNLYLSTLYEYLQTPARVGGGTAVAGPRPGDGIRFEGVSFRYPGAAEPALTDITLHVPAGGSLALVGENGSGKTTLIKLLTRLYLPTGGRILLDGLDLNAWDEARLRQRIGVIFQDFARYQMQVGENVGAGDERFFEDEARWREAAEKGRADDFIATLPAGYRTQLGRWFQDGRELSGGQWQKIALSRAFMRTEADVLVLDEPTAAMDARAEAEIFEHFRQLARGRITILISHRFSTVRMADCIAVIDGGRIAERGSHEELMALGGTYAQLFALQARGYR